MEVARILISEPNYYCFFVVVVFFQLPRRSPSLTPGGSKKTRQYILLPSSTLPKRSPGSSLNQTSERKKKDASNSPSKATKDKSKKRNRRGMKD